MPPVGSDAFAVHGEWLVYIEGSAGLPLMMTVIGGMVGGLPEGLEAFVAPQVKRTIAYIAKGVAAGPFLMGDTLSLADIQMVYMLGVAKRIGVLEDQPALADYFLRLKQQPGYLRAVERGGPMMPASSAH